MKAQRQRFAGGLLAAWALLARDLRAVRRSRSQLSSSLLFPLMLLVLLGTGVSSGLQPDHAVIPDGDYSSFLVPGMIALTALFSSTFSSAGFYRDRESGLLRALLASPHRPQTILFGSSLAAILIGTAQALFVLLLAVLIPGLDLAWQFGWFGGLLTAAAAVLLLNIMLNGLSLLLAVRIRTMQGFHLVMNLGLFPLFFLSGAFFPLSEVPTWLEVLGYLNPFTYAVDLLHYAAYADSPDGLIGPLIDGVVLTALAVLLYAFGLRRAPTAVA